MSAAELGHGGGRHSKVGEGFGITNARWTSKEGAGADVAENSRARRGAEEAVVSKPTAAPSSCGEAFCLTHAAARARGVRGMAPQVALRLPAGQENPWGAGRRAELKVDKGLRAGYEEQQARAGAGGAEAWPTDGTPLPPVFEQALLRHFIATQGWDVNERQTVAVFFTAFCDRGSSCASIVLRALDERMPEGRRYRGWRIAESAQRSVSVSTFCLACWSGRARGGGGRLGQLWLRRVESRNDDRPRYVCPAATIEGPNGSAFFWGRCADPYSRKEGRLSRRGHGHRSEGAATSAASAGCRCGLRRCGKSGAGSGSRSQSRGIQEGGIGVGAP
jgi:hypothetical protein